MKHGFVLVLVLASFNAASGFRADAAPRWEPETSTEEVPVVQATSRGIVDKASHHSFEETVARLINLLQSKGITLFSVIDHSGEAEKVALKMPATKLLIFGNPKAGTPLMLAAPTIAIDLPLKILVWEDGERTVWLSYNAADYLQNRHGLPPDLLGNIAVVETVAAAAAD